MGTQSSSAHQSLQINIISGDTQSQELFDYSSDNFQQTKSILAFPSFITQNDHQFIYTNNIPAKDCIFQITLQDNLREILIQKMHSNTQHLWKVIRNDQQQLISKGDYIKIGKLKLLVKDYLTSVQQNLPMADVNDTLNHSRSVKSISMRSSMISKDQQCRICFDSHNSINNPLVGLCKCSGSVKLMHYKCLKDWITNSLAKKEFPNYIYYSYIETHCQLCKSTINNEFTHQNINYTLLNIEKLNYPHITLQSTQLENGKHKISLYMIKLIEGLQIIIGRNNISHVMLKDISVSRTHCSILLKNKHIFLMDKKSKFGTLINLNNKMEFNINNGLALQCQSKIIQITHNKPMSSCCCQGNEEFTLVYESKEGYKQMIDEY